MIDGNTIGAGNIAYMTSDNPMGPFTYVGQIMNNPGTFFGVGGNNHHSMFEFDDQMYITYHTQTVQSSLVTGGSLDKAHGYRTTQIDKVTINSDGTIAPITMTLPGVPQQGTVNAFDRIEAETIGWDSGVQDAYKASSGIRVAALDYADSTGEQKLTNVNNGEWTALSKVDFGTGATGVTADVLPKAGGEVDIRLDAVDAAPIAALTVPAGDGTSWQKLDADLASSVSGLHDVYFTFKGTGTTELFDVDDWQFTRAQPPVTTATLDPAVPSGENGWWKGPVTLTLEATDPDSSAVTTQYALGDGVWHDYTVPVTIDVQGAQSVQFKSTDAEGNVEATRSIEREGRHRGSAGGSKSGW